MSHCLFTYEQTKGDYSLAGLKKLHPKLTALKPFAYNREEQRQEVLKTASKLSIQGIQPKLSAKLSLKDKSFIPTTKGGDYILKTQVDDYPELPQNEDLTMHLAHLAGLNVPWHGLIKASDGSLVYAIRRFDRLGRGKKLHQEDFAQLIGATRSTKYQANMEKVSDVISEHCSFPTLELEKLFQMTIFAFLVGNEDMHLKNFSLQITPKKVTTLTPVYDMVNSTIALASPEEEFALELNGKKRGLTKKDFVDYFAVEHCLMLKNKAEEQVDRLLRLMPEFNLWVEKSFLTDRMKKKYLALLKERTARLSK